jgi:hypothetical protein
MRSWLAPITTFLRKSDEPEADPRLQQIVRRQQDLKAASIQEKLSRQETDAFIEAAAAPLYNTAAYMSAPLTGDDPKA